MGSYTEVLPVVNVLSATEGEVSQDFSAPYQPKTPLLKIQELKTQSDVTETPVESESTVHPKLPSFKDIPFERTPPYPVDKLPGLLPDANVDADVDHELVVSSCLNHLNRFNPRVFTTDAIWRDLFSLTGTLRTFNGRERIGSVWKELQEQHKQSRFALIPGSSGIVRLGADSSWIQARFSYETSGQPATRCSGQIGIVPDLNFGWRIWLLTTILEEIKGFPNPDFIGSDSLNGVSDSKNDSSKSSDFDCVVVGAGFAGLCLSARLKAMGIPHVVLERNAQVGDNWRNRYDSARFHTSRDYSEMPIERIFTEDDDYFLSGQDLARGYQRYAEKHQLNIWVSSTLKSASFNEDSKIWTLQITRRGQEETVKTPHFVLAIGAGGAIPKMPELPNRSAFKGTIIHSVDYKNAEQWKGLKGVIVGTANTAHDVAEDMVAAGMSSTTMIQRGRTSVFPIEYYRKWSDPIYNRTTSIEEADRQIMATPIAVTRHASIRGHNAAVANDQERFDGLERAGFRVERNGDLWKCLSDRLGGHYMDVGASAKISAGLIKMKGDALLTGFTSTGLEFADGSTLEADVVVFCTGFEHDVRQEASKIVGPEIGDKLEDYWELDDEGELRGAYKPMTYPGIWYTGGGVTYARFYSRFVALQIKAERAGVPLRIYKKKPA